MLIRVMFSLQVSAGKGDAVLWPPRPQKSRRCMAAYPTEIRQSCDSRAHRGQQRALPFSAICEGSLPRRGRLCGTGQSDMQPAPRRSNEPQTPPPPGSRRIDEETPLRRANRALSSPVDIFQAASRRLRRAFRISQRAAGTSRRLLEASGDVWKLPRAVSKPPARFFVFRGPAETSARRKSFAG